MDCSEARWLVLAAIHGEIDQELDERLKAHVAQCESCARLLATERAFEERLRSIRVQPAPQQLRDRVARQVMARPRIVPALRFVARRAVWPLTGALAAALVLFARIPGSAPEAHRLSVGTIVCVGCVLRPETIPVHAQNRSLDHLNGFRDDTGQLWHLLDTAEHHALLVDDHWLKRRVRLRGTFYPPSRSVLIESLEQASADQARLEEARGSLPAETAECRREVHDPTAGSASEPASHHFDNLVARSSP